MKKTKNGISLIVLVITILVLSILAATVIIAISNTNAINQASKTTFKSDMSSYKEAFELYVTGRLAEDSSFDRTTLTTEDLETILGKVEEKYKNGLKVQDGKLVYETEDEAEKEVADSLGMEKLDYIGTEKKDDGKSKYIGYYVDADGDGTVDSVIFADLAYDASGTWNPAGNTNTYATTGGAWEYKAKSNLKSYVVSQESYEGKFGTAPVLKTVGSGEDRFYCMALADITSEETTNNYFTWYDAAYDSGISYYATVTKVDFGEGKTNTETMIAKWNGSEGTAEEYGDYGKQNDREGYLDVWGVIQDKVKSGWFLPSANEWAAFGSAFDITKSNYSSTYGLGVCYWSSSLDGAFSAYYALFGSGLVNYGLIGGNARSSFYVRLAATF